MVGITPGKKSGEYEELELCGNPEISLGDKVGCVCVTGRGEEFLQAGAHLLLGASCKINQQGCYVLAGMAAQVGAEHCDARWPSQVRAPSESGSLAEGTEQAVSQLPLTKALTMTSTLQIAWPTCRRYIPSGS